MCDSLSHVKELLDKKGANARAVGVDVTQTNRRNLGQAVADGLLKLIRNGEFRPGERLPTERGLMEMFGVGRNTIREAVQVLVAQEVLDVRPGRGTTVRSIGSNETIDAVTFAALIADRAVDDLYKVRRLVEVEAAGLAATDATPAQMEKITEWWNALERAYQENRPSWEEDIGFHRSIVEASGNVIYSVVVDAVTDKLVAVRRETQHVPRALKLARNEHRMVWEAIQATDAESARAAMTRHIDSAFWALDEARRRGVRRQRPLDGSF